jgi:hypothetical protein
MNAAVLSLVFFTFVAGVAGLLVALQRPRTAGSRPSEESVLVARGGASS